MVVYNKKSLLLLENELLVYAYKIKVTTKALLHKKGALSRNSLSSVNKHKGFSYMFMQSTTTKYSTND